MSDREGVKKIFYSLSLSQENYVPLIMLLVIASLFREMHKKTSRKSVRPNQLTLLTQKTHSQNNFRMTLKLSWESLKCQILLSLIHGNLGCTFNCAANLEIHDKSLFQSFLRIIFAKPGRKDPHDQVFFKYFFYVASSPLSAYGCMKVVLEMSKLWYNKLTKTTRLKTKNIKFPPLYFTEIEFDVR